MLIAPWVWPLLRGLARGLHIAGCFTLFGTCLIDAWLLPTAARPALRRPFTILAWGSFALLILAGATWFILQAADMSGAADIDDLFSAMPIVATQTRFGSLFIGRIAVLSAAMFCFQFGRQKPAAIAAGLAVTAQAWLGHGGAMTGAAGNILLATAIIHLASGSAWLGSLPALALSLRRAAITDAARLAQSFSPLGIACVIGICGSALIQYVFLIGTPGALFASAYGLVAIFKILLLAGLVALAARNRRRLTPALLTTGEPARQALLRSVHGEIALGLAILLAAALLLQLTPPSMALMLNQPSE